MDISDDINQHIESFDTKRHKLKLDLEYNSGMGNFQKTILARKQMLLLAKDITDEFRPYYENNLLDFDQKFRISLIIRKITSSIFTAINYFKNNDRGVFTDIIECLEFCLELSETEPRGFKCCWIKQKIKAAEKAITCENQSYNKSPARRKANGSKGSKGSKESNFSWLADSGSDKSEIPEELDYWISEFTEKLPRPAGHEV